MLAAAIPLDAGWQLAPSAPGAVTDPSQWQGLQWREAVVPGTVAAALGDAACEADIDAYDWWYRVEFARPAADSESPSVLVFEGLATVAEGWLNGAKLFDHQGMFTARRVDVRGKLRERNTLAIRFLALDVVPVPKSPRARWKTALVRSQALRWHRTTLLGRMPGWNPPMPAVGPWLPATLLQGAAAEMEGCSVTAWIAEGIPRLRVSVQSRRRVEALRLSLLGQAFEMPFDAAESAADSMVFEVRPQHVPRWWPHTHGEPALVEWSLEARIDGAWHAIDAGRCGFREVAFDLANGNAALAVNGVPIFCRGACWATVDLARLHGSPEATRAALVQLRDLGANMVRVGGTMTYESDAFYAACDELGLMVWQDFMFANFDFPVADEAFARRAHLEVAGQVARLGRHASIAVYCGGSEVAQQAAMMGLPEARWSNAFFLETVPALCERLHPGVPYVPSTPWGGALPFHVGKGIAHYYGVGAYRRPFSDLRTSNMRFSAESLAFSQLPEPDAVLHAFGTATPQPHAPAWKAGVPRDMGAGWDFEDVRDHYLRELYGHDPIALRAQDLDRYHALSRRVPGEVMRRAYAEWRRDGSPCGGALVWLHRDVLPGAGWGLVDVDGGEKAACSYLRRAWAPRSVHLTDEGLDGFTVHVCNETAEPLAATVELELLRHGRATMAAMRRDIEVAARSTWSIAADTLVGLFTDMGDTYCFGPPKQDVVAVRLVARDGTTVIAEDAFFPLGQALALLSGTPPRLALGMIDARTVALDIDSDMFLQSAWIHAPGWAAADNYMHVLPRHSRRVLLRRRDAAATECALELRALNLAEVVSARVATAPAGGPRARGAARAARRCGPRRRWGAPRARRCVRPTAPRRGLRCGRGRNPDRLRRSPCGWGGRAGRACAAGATGLAPRPG